MNTLQEFQDRLNIRFNDISLLERAFIHRSYLNEHPKLGLEHNERLEFLGDAVLELVVTDFLYRTYPNPEGDLTNWRSALVKTESLAAVAEKLQISGYFKLSRGEAKGNARSHSLISAVARQVDGNYLEEPGQQPEHQVINASVGGVAVDHDEWQAAAADVNPDTTPVHFDIGTA